jgi:gas vesicle protein
MIKSITTGVLATTLVATSVFAQDNRGPGMPPPGERRGEWGQEVRGMRQEYREGRQEMRGEFREDMKEARGEFKEGMKERREWMMQNASGTASGTMPTPWKNMREDMKDARKEFKEGMKDLRDKMKDEMREMMPPRMASLTATQTAAIAGKLGITVDALNAQLASGTKLKEIIKDKIKPEDMKAILPPRVASMTKAIQEQGFFNNFRSRLFGPREVEVQQSQNEYGEIEEQFRPIQSNNFLRRLFNW